MLKLLLLAALVSFFLAGILVVGFHFLVRTVLGLSATHYGGAESALGVAAVLGSLWVGLLAGRLRPEVRSEDCEDAFILACAWLALAGLAAGETGGGRFTAGEVTIQEWDGAARAAALRLQAETVLGPWLADRGFAFQGVPG